MWIEVFRTGTWTDSQGRTRTWTEADLDMIAEQYDPKHHEAPVVIGHPRDNAPAYGWVEALKRQGDRLLAKIKPTVKEFVDWVRKGLYKKVSISLYPDLTLRHIGFLGAQPPAVKGLRVPEFEDGSEFMEYEFEENLTFIKRIFQRLRDFLIEKFGREDADAVIPQFILDELDRQIPEVQEAFSEPMEFRRWTAEEREALAKGEIKGEFAGPGRTFPIAGPKDVADAWRLAGHAKNPEQVRRNIIRIAKKYGWVDALPETARKWAEEHGISLKEAEMDELEKLKVELQEKERQLKEFAERDAQRQKEIEALRQRIEKAEAERRRLELEQFCDSLEAEGRLTPAQRQRVLELMEVLGSAEEYEFSEAEGKVKKQPLVAFKEFLKGLPKVVETGEVATKDKVGADTGKTAKMEFSGRVDEERLKLHQKAMEYVEKEGISYVDAVRKAMKEV